MILDRESISKTVIIFYQEHIHQEKEPTPTMKKFNTTGLCLPEKHYMADISKQLRQIKKHIDEGDYFSINRARQYGKTTTLNALAHFLEKDYLVISLDFQALGNASFRNENIFSLTFAEYFLRELQLTDHKKSPELTEQLNLMMEDVQKKDNRFVLFNLFGHISSICHAAEKPIVLMIDEVDSAAGNQVFWDFLAQLRYYYLERSRRSAPTFHSVVLAGVYDIRRLKMKIRPEDEHKVNSPWNIAADFNVDMNLSFDGIRQMLEDYENDHHTGMDAAAIARLIYDYTSGYPFLVSRICKLIDEETTDSTEVHGKSEAWTKDGVLFAIRTLIAERNTLFESLSGKLDSYPELDRILCTLLFVGKDIPYNADNEAITLASMFGFVKNSNGNVVITNRIFETRLYNRFLSTEELQENDIFKASLWDKNQFIVRGHLNMRLILERFTQHFNDIYAGCDEKFVEESGRKLFLLYLRPIINGSGNYYIESRTRSMGRTDVIVDYRGEQYIIEMKIWRGQEYLNRSEQQIIGYLNDYHQKKGYLLSFCFNKKKQIGVQEIVIGDKTVIEAIV